MLFMIYMVHFHKQSEAEAQMSDEILMAFSIQYIIIHNNRCFIIRADSLVESDSSNYAHSPIG